MTSPRGTDEAPKGEDLGPSSSSSRSSFSSRDISTTTSRNGTTTEPTSLMIRVLQEITDNFSEARALGQGAYGKVYQGVLENGDEIAVKLLYNNMQAIDDTQFQREFDSLKMFDHPNIVPVVGYCYDTQRQHMDGEDLGVSRSRSRSSSSFTGRDSTTTSRSGTTTEPTRLTIRVLQEITDNFSDARALGQGAYGKVYKGVLDNGDEIAVKLLYNNIEAIDDTQFQREFDNLMMLNHRNIVRLVSYCYETQRQHMDFEGRIVFGETTYRALCFEYMHMGSLKRHLSEESSGLDWQTRYKIIKGTCEGLKYLHEGFKKPFYHLDLKPDNILLDKNLVPKLADFGLSKLFGEEQTRVTQGPTGTIGYMPPEYLFGHVVSKKVDIFSLGVVITQIIAGPRGHTRSAEMPYQEFLNQVQQNWMNRMEETSFSQLQMKTYCDQLTICIEIGVSCMALDREERPSIVDIIHRLDQTEYPKVHLCAMAQYDALARSQSLEMPVMIRVKAPRHAGGSRVPINLVVILDMSSSSERLEQVKQGLLFVVHNLEVEDRLSILQCFQTGTDVMFPLTDMSEPQKTTARNKIKKLAIIDHFHTDDVERAMETAYKILQEGPDDKNRVSSIMLLTDGSDKTVDIERLTGRFPIYTFGMGCQHDSCTMYDIATGGRGTYSFVDGQDFKSVLDAMALCIGGLTSLIAQRVKVFFSCAQPDVTISRIACGAYDHHVEDASGSITIDDLYSSEEKSFLIYVKVPIVKGFRRTTNLLTVKANYYCLVTGKDDVEVGPVQVSIRRPIKVRRETISVEVTNEAFRADVLEKVNKISIQSDGDMDTISEKLKNIQDSIDTRQVGRHIWDDISTDLDEMQVPSTGLPYMLSWLSSHQWQRAATLGSTCTSTFSFKTGRMQNMIDSVDSAQVLQHY